MIDIHSHILPGLDDGPQDMEESVAMARQAEEVGFTKIVATPHAFGRGYEPNFEKRDKKLRLLQKELDQQNINIELIPGFEVGISPEIVRADDTFLNKFCIGKTNAILLELPWSAPPHGIDSFLFALKARGFCPILAHLERYTYLRKYSIYVNQFVIAGAIIQINFASLLGLHGKNVEKFAKDLIKKNKNIYLASDAHDIKYRNYSFKQQLILFNNRTPCS